MSDTIQIYLGKSGQTFGPYTIAEFEEIKKTPDFRTYTYIWDGRDANPDWKALELPPAAVAAPVKRGPGAPPPDAVVKAPDAVVKAPEAAAQPRAAAPKPALRGYDVPGLEAVCHDSRSVASGKLVGVTDSGCELVTNQRVAEPAFGATSNVTLNLLDPATGKSMNVAARLGGVQRKDGAWSYKVLWQGCPQLVLQQLEKAS
jgi:hypothetical protein